MKESRVGIRELKSKLSEYLRRVKAGEAITVTDHGKPVGRIIPILPGIEDRMLALVASGLVEWDGQKPGAYTPRALNRGNRQLSDLVVEDRE